MPRASTQLSVTRAWIRRHRAALADHGPQCHQLTMLAQSMDTDLAAKGTIQAAQSTAYRQLLDQLQAHVTAGPTEQASRGTSTGGGPAALDGPGGAELVG